MSTDEELFESFRLRGDRVALDKLFRRHVDAVYRNAFRVLRNEADAEDASQNTFLNVIRSASTWQSGTSFRGWLYRIAVNAALRRRESRQARATRLFESEGEVRMRSSGTPALEESLNALSDEYRLPILLHHYEQLSYDEIAQALNCPRGTVGTRIHRGLEKLREALAASGAVVTVSALIGMLHDAEAATAPPSVVEAVSESARSVRPPTLNAEVPTVRKSGWKTPTRGLMVVSGLVVVGAFLLVLSLSKGSDRQVDTREIMALGKEGATQAKGISEEPDESPALRPEKKLEVDVLREKLAQLEEDLARERKSKEELERRFQEAQELILAASLAGNEKRISNVFRNLATMEYDFRSNDRDGDGFRNFWVADIRGLYTFLNKGVEIKLIGKDSALADGRPSSFSPPFPDHQQPVPKHGYLFSVLRWYVGAEGAMVEYDRGSGRNPAGFGLVAYPADYGKTGRHTFIVAESNVLWRKDCAGRIPDVFPGDPRKEGWESNWE